MAEAARQERNRKDNLFQSEIVTLLHTAKDKNCQEADSNQPYRTGTEKNGWYVVTAEVSALLTTLRSVEDLKENWQWANFCI